MPFEDVIVDNHGTTKQQYVLPKGWQSEYQRYLAEYEKADNKAAFNASFQYADNV